MMINGRMEMFSDVSSMIIRWEKEEESLLGTVEPGERRPRRRSQGVHELCAKFESTVDDQDIPLEIDVRGRERKQTYFLGVRLRRMKLNILYKFLEVMDSWWKMEIKTT